MADFPCLCLSMADCNSLILDDWVMLQVEGNGFQDGGWGESERGGGPGGGKQRGPAGVVAVRTDGGEQGASYSGISPDSVGAGHDLTNGLASPARRHPSGNLGCSCTAAVRPFCRPAWHCTYREVIHLAGVALSHRKRSAPSARSGLSDMCHGVAGVSEWGTGSDGTNLNSRDQLLSHNKGRSSMGGNASPHGQVSLTCMLLLLSIRLRSLTALLNCPAG